MKNFDNLTVEELLFKYLSQTEEKTEIFYNDGPNGYEDHNDAPSK